MQLILTQNDIETALINYANELITVKEGMVITVELKATRGADGATAIIDISPAGEAAKAEPVKPTPVVSKPAETRQVTAKASEIVKDKPEVKTPEPEVETQDADPSPDEQQQEAGTDDGEDAAAEANAAEESAEVAEVPETPAAKPKSLFEGLRKPKNE